MNDKNSKPSIIRSTSNTPSITRNKTEPITIIIAKDSVIRQVLHLTLEEVDEIHGPRENVMCLKKAYILLELPVNDSLDNVNNAYRRLVLSKHPDKNNNDPNASSKFMEIQRAYKFIRETRFHSGIFV